MTTMTTMTAPLSIAIIGAGRIGSSSAYQLAQASHQVTIVARPGSTWLAQLGKIDKKLLRTRLARRIPGPCRPTFLPARHRS